MSEKVLTIQRSKWRRGGNTDGLSLRFGPTQMLNGQGMMCCLGFDALGCGLQPEDILDRLWPSSIVNRGDSVVSADSEYARRRIVANPLVQNLFDDAPATASAMKHNDSQELSDETREALISEDLKALGWDDVVFVD